MISAKLLCLKQVFQLNLRPKLARVGWSLFRKLTEGRFKNCWLMQDTLAAVLQTAVIGNHQTSRFTKTFSRSLTALRIRGSSVGRLRSTSQPPRSCACCFSLKVTIGCSNHAEEIPGAYIWIMVYSVWSHFFKMATLAIFRGVAARVAETRTSLWIVRLASTGRCYFG